MNQFWYEAHRGRRDGGHQRQVEWDHQGDHRCMVKGETSLGPFHVKVLDRLALERAGRDVEEKKQGSPRKTCLFIVSRITANFPLPFLFVALVSGNCGETVQTTISTGRSL